jgi:hypothetical protein
VALILQTGTATDQVVFDDVTIRQVSPIAGRVLDGFGALRQAGRFFEPGATLPAEALAEATADLAKARDELGAALAQNADPTAQALAAQIAGEAERLGPEVPGTDSAPGDRANTLNALALLAREAAAGLQVVDVRGEGK